VATTKRTNKPQGQPVLASDIMERINRNRAERGELREAIGVLNALTVALRAAGVGR